MIQNTKGIVLRQIKYGESGIIARIYTRLYGLQSYLVHGVRKKKSKIKANLFQPLTLLDMEVLKRENKELHRIIQIRVIPDCSGIQQDLGKTSIALFLADLQYKCIREEEANLEMFDFLWGTVIDLAKNKESIANYHLSFMISFSKYLGFYPNASGVKMGWFFDQQEGVFVKNKPDHRDYIPPHLSDQLIAFLSNPSGNGFVPELPGQDRSELLEHLLRYYQIQLPNMQNIQSHRILKTVLN
jgi:DNA repair protein RecO (recombination protein O)